MQHTLVLRTAKHMRVIGLLEDSICQRTEQQQTAGAQHPDMDAPAGSALSSTEMYSVLKCNLWETKMCSTVL